MSDKDEGRIVTSSVVDLEALGLTLDPELGEEIDWKTLQDPHSYYPTRLEYFAGKALQGLVAGRSPAEYTSKRIRAAAQVAVDFAQVLEEFCDQAQD
jgi:hypothetical protein